MHGRSLKMVLLFLMVPLVFPPLLYSGWLLKDRDGATTFIADGRIKHVEDEESGSFLVIDYTKEQILLVDGARQVYATASLDEYCRMMQHVIASFSQMDEAPAGAGEAQPRVEVVAVGRDDVGGLEATKFRVMVDGQLYEELWLTTEAGLMRELGDTDRHRQFMECLDASGDPVEGSPAYRSLAEKGWELRSISYDFEEGEYNSDTESAERVDVSAESFSPPKSYRQMDLEELFMSGGE